MTLVLSCSHMNPVPSCQDSFLPGTPFRTTHPTVRSQVPTRCQYLHLHLTDVQTEAQKGRATCQGHTTVEHDLSCLLLHPPGSPFNLSSPTSGSSLPWAPSWESSAFCCSSSQPCRSHPHIHDARGGGKGQSTHLLSLELSLLPGANNSALTRPSRRPGTGQASLRPLDTTAWLTLCRGTCFAQRGHKPCLLPSPAGDHPSQFSSPPGLHSGLLTLSSPNRPRPPLGTAARGSSLRGDLPGDV